MLLYAQILALFGLAVGTYGIYRAYLKTIKRPLPADRSPVKGSPTHGITYAFTAGMMPWSKESTRIHMLAYLRGIGFHIGIFTALGVFLISPFWAFLPGFLTTIVVLTRGAVLGAAGGIMRIAEHNLRGLSVPDDHFAVWLVTIFIASSALAMWSTSFLVPFYIITAVTLIYMPLGKIRHCLYFFFSRIFYGKFFGRRAVFPHPKPIAERQP
jgi:hypothetical protein